jgi:uncharacterized protein
MLLIDATVGPSAIQGLGLIANQFVPAGAKVWVFGDGLDVELTEQQMSRLSPAARGQALRYTYRYPGTDTYLLCGDDARFTNHSDNPNTRCRDDHTYATRDILPGEEITSDYAEFDSRFDGRFSVPQNPSGDSSLRKLAAAWPDLSDAIRKAILAMLDANR